MCVTRGHQTVIPNSGKSSKTVSQEEQEPKPTLSFTQTGNQSHAGQNEATFTSHTVLSHIMGKTCAVPLSSVQTSSRNCKHAPTNLHNFAHRGPF